MAILEKEVKILNIPEIPELERILIEKGATQVKNECQKNYVLKADDILFKFRKVHNNRDNCNSYYMILKSKPSDFKDNLEPNTKILSEATIELNEAAFNSIIEYISENFKWRLEGTKDRLSYELNGFLFEIDTWQPDIFPMPYLEIEAIDINNNIADVINLVFGDAAKGLIVSTNGITALHEDYVMTK